LLLYLQIGFPYLFVLKFGVIQTGEI
jgi:hypothetical protein